MKDGRCEQRRRKQVDATLDDIQRARAQIRVQPSSADSTRPGACREQNITAFVGAL